MHNKVGNGKQCWCPECKTLYHKAKSAEWERNHRTQRNDRFKNDESRAKRVQWSKETNQSEKRKEYHRKRYQDNKIAMRKKMDEWRAANLDKWNGYSRKYRTLKRGAISMPYLGSEIFSRDKGICGLCDQPIDMSLRFPNNKSFSVDHIVPLALGGDDTPENVQASHLGCNASKAHRV